MAMGKATSPTKRVYMGKAALLQDARITKLDLCSENRGAISGWKTGTDITA
jgi:hypothetical protein